MHSELYGFHLGLKIPLQCKKNQTMKAVFTLFAIVFLGTVAMAQTGAKEEKVATITMEVSIEKAEIQTSVEAKGNTEIARLYMFKNSRVKKALAFKTKRNRSKMA